MAAIPVPVPGDPTAQSWAAAVAGALGGLKGLGIGTATKAYEFGNGRVTIPASDFGLTTISGLLVNVTPVAALALVNIVSGLGSANVEIIGIAWVYAGGWPSIPSDVVGWQTLSMLAWGTAP